MICARDWSRRASPAIVPISSCLVSGSEWRADVFGASFTRVELRHLRYFVAVADALNFSRAAEKLRVAQPALSRQIKALEDEIGVQLLERNRVRVQLTDAGRTLRAHALKLLMQADLAVTAARQASHGQDGRLIVGSDWRLAVGVIPEVVAAFRKKYPRVDVEMTELRMNEQLPALRAGRIHVGFLPCHLIGSRRDIEMLPVVNAALEAVLPVTHPLASRHDIRLRELKGEPWVWIDDRVAQGFKTFTTQLCRLAGFVPAFGKSATTLEGLLGLIAAGYGVSVIPDFVIPERRIMVRHVATDCQPFELCAAWRSDASSVVLANFLAMLRKCLHAKSGDAPAMPPKASLARAAAPDNRHVG